MRIFTRGTNVSFTHTFYDSSGNATLPTTANLYITYPTTGFPYRNVLESTTVTLTADSTTFEWSGRWNSAVAQPGNVFWHIRAESTLASAEDGQFRLSANPANLSVTT